MTHWNHRVVRHEYDFSEDIEYVLHECLYEDGAEPDSLPRSWIAEPATPRGNDLEDLRAELEHFQRALELPILLINHNKHDDYLELEELEPRSSSTVDTDGSSV